jgi:HlyD family secretion protein
MDSGKSFEVQILIDTKGLPFFSGLSADADIEVRRHEEVLKVPTQAVLGLAPDALSEELRRRPEVDVSKATVPVVYRMVNGEAVATPVVIGASDLTHTLIKSGLNAGDEVIVGPYKALESLKQGQKVKYEGNSPATRPATTTTTAPTTKTVPATQPISSTR